MPDPLPDRLQDAAILRATQIERYSVGLTRDVLRMLRGLEQELLEQLQHPTMDPTIPIRTAFQRRRLEVLLDETQRTINAHYRTIHQETRPELIGLATAEQAAVVAGTNAEIGAVLMRPNLSPERLRALVDDTFISGGASQAAPIREWWGRQAASMQQRVAATLRQGILRDETIGQLTRRLRGTKAARYQDGILAISRRDAETLARTAALSVANTAREATLLANPEVIFAIAAVTTRDARTSPICIARTGAIWRASDGRPLPSSTRQEPYPGPPTWHWR